MSLAWMIVLLVEAGPDEFGLDEVGWMSFNWMRCPVPAHDTIVFLASSILLQKTI